MGSIWNPSADQCSGLFLCCRYLNRLLVLHTGAISYGIITPCFLDGVFSFRWVPKLLCPLDKGFLLFIMIYCCNFIIGCYSFGLLGKFEAGYSAAEEGFGIKLLSLGETRNLMQCRWTGNGSHTRCCFVFGETLLLLWGAYEIWLSFDCSCM